MKEIENFMDHLECPLVNGIVFSDNTIQLFEEVPWEKPVEIKIQSSSTTSINDLENEGKLSWCGCAILDKYIDETDSIKAFCGEGNFGDDGFVSVMDLKKDKVIWVAYFTSSNPFYKVTIEEGQVSVFSTIDFVWKFDIDRPFVVEVMSLP